MAARIDVDRLRTLERENDRLRRSVEELSLLNDLAREIGAARDTEAVMQSVVRRALKSVGAEQGTLTLVEERDGDPLTTLVRTAGSNTRRTPYHLDDHLLGWMLYHKKPLRLIDPASDERFREAAWHPDLHSLLCVPLMTRARLIGLLAVFNKRHDAGFSDDDQRLLSIIAGQSAQLVENARLHEQELALRRVRRELGLAREIQTALLPTAPPEVPGYEIAGLSRPAQSVGGDFFDYLPMRSGRRGLGVADVAGKGLPAALMMANVQATLRGQALGDTPPEVCLAHVNDLLKPRLRKGSFVTLFYGLLDPQAHTLRYANAGHNRPLLARAEGRVEPLELGGPALGLLPKATYEAGECVLAPGDALLIYSDGVPEAMNGARQQFGDDQLAGLLAEHAAEPARALVARLAEAVRLHAGRAPTSDDVTLLCIQRLP